MGKIDQKNTCIFLTGTIVPNSNFVAHADPIKRRNEYLQALKFYSEMFRGFRIYFLENSTYDIETDNEIMEMSRERKFDVMKFPVSDKFSEGKGYQEFLMLDGAVAAMKSQYRSFIKVTGRYLVKNLDEICVEKKAPLKIDLHKKPRVAQTNVFMCDFDFYEHHLAGLYKEANDSKGIFIERVIYNKLVKEHQLSDVQMFEKNPVLQGFSGSYGTSLRRNPKKMALRNFERKILKGLGVKQFLIEY